MSLSIGDPTRFAGLSPWASRLILIAVAALIAIGLALPPRSGPTGQPGAGDAALYRAVATRVAAGQPYHAAAATEQRLRNYPVRPATTMRPPALAEIGAWIGFDSADLLLRLIGLATVAATVMRLAPTMRFPAREGMILLAATSGGLLLQPHMWVWHEAWAGYLIALAIAVRSERHWAVAVVLGLSAALIREFAFPFLLVMAGTAWIEGRRRETAAWGIAAMIALVALGWHLALATAIALPGDRASPGWLVFGGWRFAVTLARESALLLSLPAWVSAVVLPLAMLGWVGLRGGYALRVTLMLVLWLGAFLFIGRPDNAYWGLLLSPLLPVGLALAPAALRDLAGGAATLALRPLSGETRLHPLC